MTDDSFDFDRLTEAAALRAEELRKASENKTANGADAAPDPHLIEMNDKYSVVQIGGKTRVVRFEESPVQKGCLVPIYSSLRDFKDFEDRRKKTIAVDGKSQIIGMGTWWIKQPDRAQYDGIVYAPNRETPGRLNLWKGFGCKPVKGGCGLYLSHLREIVCGGNETYYEYLMSYMAHNVQHPDCPGEVAIVLRGEEGAGKGILVKQFGPLFGAHYRHVVQAAHLVGKFNAHLQHCSCLYADEAFFAGERQHESVLKALITEPTLMIEQKGLDAFQARNCIHLYISSNSNWVIPAGARARRYFVLDVLEAKRGDRAYFDAIVKQMECDGGREALLDLLLGRDISKFDIRDAPQTAALAEQKQFSRREIDQLIEVIAEHGELPCAHSSKANVAITTGEERGEGFYAACKKLVRGLSYSSASVISKALRKDWGCRSWKDTYRRGIEFPPLAELREKFDERHGPQEWGEPEEWLLPGAGFDSGGGHGY
jgi:Mesyanzhinovviridae DNA primase